MLKSNSTVLVSVIMPVYNGIAYLEEALKSFFSQTISDRCELICIDDGSTDGSAQVLDSYSANHPDNMVVLHQPNQGSGRSRNAGMDIARGSYVGFLDADDLYPADSVLESLSSALERSHCNIAGGSVILFNDEVESSDFAHVEGFEGHQFLQEGMIDYRDYQFDYGYQRFLYARDFLDSNELRFPDYLRYQDPPFFVRAMIAAGAFYAIVEPTYKYRTNSNAAQWTEEKITHMFAAITDIAEMAAEHDLERLFLLNLRRLDVDNRQFLHDYVFGNGDLDALSKIQKARSKITALANGVCQKAAFDQVSPIEEEVREALKKHDSLMRDIQWAGELIDELDGELKGKNDELARVYSSTTWRVGRLATTVPRFAKDRLG